jgi:hypothetical protein
MSLRILRPQRPLDVVGAELKSRAEGMVDAMATIAQDTLAANTPNRWKGYLYKAVTNRERIPGGHGVGGPVGPGGLLPEKKAAPNGVISAFLARHPEYVTRNRGGHRDFPYAWWYLPLEAKKKLRDERMAGDYGFPTPTAPYWIIAEKGSASADASSRDVGVPAIRYLEKSRPAIESGVEQLAKGFVT